MKLGPVRVMVLGVELMLCVHKVQCEAWWEAYYFTSFDGHLSFTKKILNTLQLIVGHVLVASFI